MSTLKFQYRLAAVCFAAATTALPMALISIAKLTLMLCALSCIFMTRGLSKDKVPTVLWAQHTFNAIFMALGAFTLSLMWTTGPSADALGSIVKYGKLLSIVLMMCLIRSREEAFRALGAFLLTQAFLVGSSWLLFFGVPLPWTTASKVMVESEFAVFSTYLDQGLITVTTGAICWHLRKVTPWRHGSVLLTGLTLTCFANVLFVLGGRTGHTVAIVLLSLAILWQLPRRWRPAMVVVPFVILGGLLISSDKFRDRLELVKFETHAYSQSSIGQQTTSSGIRLQLWTGSLQMMVAHPWLGSGVGSWSTEYNRQSINHTGRNLVGSNFNPHQEYLLWGVQLGLPGIALLLGLFIAIFTDIRSMEPAVSRAAQSTLAALMVACLFNSSLYDALIGDFFCVTLGLLLALGTHRQPALQPTLDISLSDNRRIA